MFTFHFDGQAFIPSNVVHFVPKTSRVSHVVKDYGLIYNKGMDIEFRPFNQKYITFARDIRNVESRFSPRTQNASRSEMLIYGKTHKNNMANACQHLPQYSGD